MSFKFKYSLNGATPVYEKVPAGAVAVSAQAVVYNSSGYAIDTSVPTTVTIIGVNENAVDNSGGAAGDLNLNVIVSPDAVYEIDTGDTMAQAQVWKIVAVVAGGLTVTSNTAVTDTTGVVRLRKFVSASKAYGNLYFTGELA